MLRLLNKRIPLCNVTKKTLKNCISTILQGQILRLDTLGLVGYFTSLEDISLCPLKHYVNYAFFSAIAACAAARRAIGTRNGEQDT